MKQCKHKQCTTPIEEQEFANNKATKDGLQIYCKACKSRMHLERMAKPGKREQHNKNSSEYYKTEAGKTTAKKYKDKYRSTAEGIATEAASKAAYRASEHGKLTEKLARKKYNESEHGKAVNTAYWQSEKGKEVRRVANHRRRAACKSTDDGSITTESLCDLKAEQDHKCFYCKNALDFKGYNKVHLDHYIPLAKGGTHTLSNVKWSCQKCNQSKNDKLPEEFIKEKQWKNC